MKPKTSGLPSSRKRTTETPESHMMDLLYIAMTVAFFVLSIAYVHACGKL
jgi:hypothetical protein